MSEAWPWLALLGLGAFHGINPGMGWLFAVAPRAAGTAAFCGLERPAADRCRTCASPWDWLLPSSRSSMPAFPTRHFVGSRLTVLVGFGVYRLVRARHPRWVGMRVGFGDLTLMVVLDGLCARRGTHARPRFSWHAPMYDVTTRAARTPHTGADLELLNHPWLRSRSRRCIPWVICSSRVSSR